METSESPNWRYEGIGSSDAPSVMGVGFRTPYQLWDDKIHRREVPDNYAMKRGRDMEEPARRSFESKIGVAVLPGPFIHPQYNWMGASLDGIDLDRKVAVEIKCPLN